MHGSSKNTSVFFRFLIGAACVICAVFLFTAAAVSITLIGKLVSNTAENSTQVNSTTAAGTAVYDKKRNGEVLRLHIIANSDDERDQRIKIKVRDAILEKERAKSEVLTSITAFDAEEAMLKNGSELLETVRTVLKNEDAQYDAQLVLGDFEFPDREYDGMLYPAGEYRALRVLLGNAEGKNWWCVLFPPLCIIKTEADTETASYKNENAEREKHEERESIRFESFFYKLFTKLIGDKDED